MAMLPYICNAWEMAWCAKNKQINKPTTLSKHYPYVVFIPSWAQIYMFCSVFLFIKVAFAHAWHLEALVCGGNGGVWCVRASGGGLGEGQGCVCNVNTVKATDTKGRGGRRERRAPSGPMYPLSSFTVLQPSCKLKTRAGAFKIHLIF